MISLISFQRNVKIKRLPLLLEASPSRQIMDVKIEDLLNRGVLHLIMMD